MTEIARYLVAGSLAAAVDFALFAVLAAYLRFDYLAVGCFTFVAATYANYVLSVRFVFESGVRFQRRQEIALVFLVSALGLVLNQAVLFVGVEWARLDILISKLCATGTVFAWNYNARSRFVFRRMP